jgi:hypothetical protein
MSQATICSTVKIDPFGDRCAITELDVLPCAEAGPIKVTIETFVTLEQNHDASIHTLLAKAGEHDTCHPQRVCCNSPSIFRKHEVVVFPIKNVIKSTLVKYFQEYLIREVADRDTVRSSFVPAFNQSMAEGYKTYHHYRSDGLATRRISAAADIRVPGDDRSFPRPGPSLFGQCQAALEYDHVIQSRPWMFSRFKVA